MMGSSIAHVKHRKVSVEEFPLLRCVRPVSIGWARDIPDIRITQLKAKRSRRMNVRTIPVCAALLLSATTVHAQACIGLASLETRPMNFTAGAAFTDGAKGGDARFSIGTSKAFGGVSALITKVDGVSGTAKGAGVDGGLSYRTGKNKRVMVCPVASVSYLKSPDFDDGEGEVFEASATGGNAGLAVGGVISSSSSVSAIPFGELRAAYTRASVTNNGVSVSSSETYGVLSGGVGFVFSPSLLVRPYIQIPFGLEGADASYGVGVSFAFGKR
jgi:hypothetical protein